MAVFYRIFPTLEGGILIEFEVGNWDLSVEFAKDVTIEFYGLRISDGATLEPLSFSDIDTDLVREIDTRIHSAVAA